MYKRVFLDANILLDIMDRRRLSREFSAKVIQYCLKNKIELFSSCDIITTIYYVERKRDKNDALRKIDDISSIIEIIEFSNIEVSAAIRLVRLDVYKDLEDTIQYVLAKKTNCDLIISNDKVFVSVDIPILSSEEFCRKLDL